MNDQQKQENMLARTLANLVTYRNGLPTVDEATIINGEFSVDYCGFRYLVKVERTDVSQAGRMTNDTENVPADAPAVKRGTKRSGRPKQQ